jgi:hypothetical protein
MQTPLVLHKPMVYYSDFFIFLLLYQVLSSPADVALFLDQAAQYTLYQPLAAPKVKPAVSTYTPKFEY